MKIARKVIFIVALIVFIVSAGYLIQHFLKGQSEENDFESLRVDGGYDLQELYKKNKDIVGWLKIEDTKVNYPVMQTPLEPEFYLRRNFEKEESMAGTPFVDAGSDMKKPSMNWLIHGHNMKNGTMFHDILKYEKEDFYKKHKTITFDTLKGKGEYQVVAAFYTKIYSESSKKFKYYNYASILDENNYNTYVQNSKQLCTYNTGVTPKYGEQLISLSTCAYNEDDARFVVVARKIK